MEKQQRRRRGCCLFAGAGCIGFAGLLIVMAAAVLIFNRSEAEARYSGAQDLAASSDFEQVFLDLNITGVEVIVIPARDSEGAVLIIKMDESKGFSNIAGAGFDGVLSALNDKIQQGGYDIDYISLVYIGPEGDVLFTMTTDEETVAQYAAGELTRREFMGDVSLDVEGLMDIIELYNEAAP